MTVIKFQKLRDVRSPERNGLDSGFDFFVPNDLVELSNAENCKFTPSEFIEDQKARKDALFTIDLDNPSGNYIELPPRMGILIPSGIRMQLPKGDNGYTYDMVFANKSGISTKLGLLVGAQVIDNQYRGEIHIHVINTSDYTVFITPGMKIAQAILRKVELMPMNEVDNIDTNTSRGEGGFGSTGN